MARMMLPRWKTHGAPPPVARYGADAEEIRIDVLLIRPWRLPMHLKNVWHG